ncbi:helix-turn-helix protein [compost metagenome]
MNQVLIDARKQRGMTISQAAESLGISHGMLAMLETGKRNGSDKTKIKIAKFYNKSIIELFYNNY